ncbi:MAG: DNA cytosine methyltransferase [Caldilineaceae bacterium]|jgi:DNA (cytosine-5)-methyltransferase 1|nr:DNA cytosine methyltransferase [Caldilineaceae bacterium]
MTAPYKYYEFFAGGGMARLGLGAQWTCLLANDFSPKKAESYRRNFPPADEFVEGDVFDLQVSDLPPGADMAWASFPCQDLSLAGNGQGLNGLRSGSFWGFWRLVQGLANEHRPLSLVVLENVVGTITANQGQDFAVLLKTLVDANYRVGPMVIDAQHFIPQSRPRLFVVAAHNSIELPAAIVQKHPDPRWHPVNIVRAQSMLPKEVKARWIWWNMPYPAPRSFNLLDIIEEEPAGVQWHSAKETNRLLELMSPVNLEKVKKAQQKGERVVGAIYRRIRTSGGQKQQRAEIRIDDLSGCLRTGSGGSSKQFIMVIEGDRIRSRLLSPREAARLMGVDDSYVLPEKYSDAYHLMGDGLAVPVVSWLSETILTPALTPGWSVDEAYRPKSNGLQLRILDKKPSEVINSIR